jgi:hypothetical protein
MNEEVAVTTTNNGGAGLVTPQIPIKPTVFTRVKELIKKKKNSIPQK